MSVGCFQNPALVFVTNVLITIYTFLQICKCGILCGMESNIIQVILIGYWVNVGLVCLDIVKPDLRILGSPIRLWVLAYSYLFFMAPVTQLFIGLSHMIH